jgi:hypothetical protein|tara:strand:- start:3153 stop:3395 length:243 start_codon:yes stop_codon:yes gene_type:complete
MNMELRRENEVLKMKLSSMGCTLDAVEFFKNEMQKSINEIEPFEIANITLLRLKDAADGFNQLLEFDIPKEVLRAYREDK